MPVGIAYGVFLSVGMTIMLCCIIAWMVYKEWIPQTSIGYGVMVLLTISSYCGAWYANRKIKHRKLLTAGLTAVSYFVTLLIMTGLFFGGQYAGVGETALMILCGTGLWLLKPEMKKTKKYRQFHKV